MKSQLEHHSLTEDAENFRLEFYNLFVKKVHVQYILRTIFKLFRTATVDWQSPDDHLILSTKHGLFFVRVSKVASLLLTFSAKLWLEDLVKARNWRTWCCVDHENRRPEPRCRRFIKKGRELPFPGILASRRRKIAAFLVS